jgi:hypothetical protein
MTRRNKIIDRLLSRPKDFTYDELAKVLNSFGYQEVKTGKTSGSRRAFVNSISKHIIRLHKPHPGNLLKMYQIDYIIQELIKENFL